MSNIIVECRNKDSDSAKANGDWSTTLPENIVISNGDQIMIKDSYIDTQQTSSSTISIPEDISVSLDYGFYLVMNDVQEITNWTGTPQPAAGGTAKPYLTPTYNNLVLCIETAKLTTEQIVEAYVVTTETKGVDSRNGNITFYWVNEVGDEIERRINIDSVKANEFKQIDELTGVITTPDLVRTREDLSSLGLKLFTQDSKDAKDKVVLQPYTQTITVDILKGNYTAEQINETLNREINNNVANQSTFPTVEGKMLQTARQIQQEYVSSGTTKLRDFAICDITDDTDNPFRLNPMYNYTTFVGEDIFLGGSIFEMDYSDSSKQFEIKYMHTPFYNQNQIAIAIYENAAKKNYTTVNKLTGNYFTRMYATKKSDKEPFDFWDSLLGLDTASIQTYFEFRPFTTTIAPVTDLLVPVSTNFVDGAGITGGNSSIDAVVAKTGTLNVPTAYPFFAGSDPGVTEGIYGSALNALDTENAFGYYLIEIKSHFKNKFLTEDNNWSGISQIVNRYFELNSYTATEGGSIVYIHKGEDILLQSFNCRVLTSDKKLAPNIGPDNTVHLQIIKAQSSE